MKRVHALLITLILVVPVVVLTIPLRQHISPVVQRLLGKKTVSDRVRQYGHAVQQRLLPHFQAANVPYPPQKIFLVGLKQEKKLEIWACGSDSKFKLIRIYPIFGSSGRLGPKLKQGDNQVPEGLYRIESLNPNSRFHLSLKLDYPNDFDRTQARRDGRTNLGGEIMIHGSNVSIGCLAMGDQAIEDLFILATETGLDNISVVLAPVDFRTTEIPKLTYPLPEWTNILYEQIKNELTKLTNNS